MEREEIFDPRRWMTMEIVMLQKRIRELLFRYVNNCRIVERDTRIEN